MSFSSLFLSMLLSINQTSHQYLAFNFNTYASFMLSHEQRVISDTPQDHQKIAPHSRSFFDKRFDAPPTKEVEATQLLVSDTLKRVQKIRSLQTTKTKKLDDVSESLAEANFQLLKNNLDLIVQDHKKQTLHYFLNLIARAQGNPEFQRLLFEFMKNTHLHQLKSVRALEALIEQSSKNPELLENILNYGVSLAESNTERVRLLEALSVRSKGNGRLQRNIFHLVKIMGRSGLQVLGKLAAQTYGNPKLQCELLEFVEQKNSLETLEGVQILASLAKESSGQTALQESLFELAKNTAAPDSQLLILEGLAQSRSRNEKFGHLLYAEIKNRWNATSEATVARIFLAMTRSTTVSADIKKDIFEKIGSFNDVSKRNMLLETFAKTSAKDPRLQSNLLKNYILPISRANDRGPMLAALAGQSQYNPELQLELFESLREMTDHRQISLVLSELIKCGTKNRSLFHRIEKYIETHFSQLEGATLLTQLAVKSRENVTLQNWVIHRLANLNEKDQIQVLIALSTLPKLESDIREKIKELLQSKSNDSAKEGLILLSMEL